MVELIGWTLTFPLMHQLFFLFPCLFFLFALFLNFLFDCFCCWFLGGIFTTAYYKCFHSCIITLLAGLSVSPLCRGYNYWVMDAPALQGVNLIEASWRYIIFALFATTWLLNNSGKYFYFCCLSVFFKYYLFHIPYIITFLDNKLFVSGINRNTILIPAPGCEFHWNLGYIIWALFATA